MRWSVFVLAALACAQDSRVRTMPGRGEANTSRVVQPAGPPGAISGRVVGVSGEPLRKADVVLRGMRAGSEQSTQTVTTDATGTFAFEAIPPGTYSLSAQRNGYVRQEHGARAGQAVRGGSPVTVAPGQSVTGISFKMIPHAVVTGKVVDEDGEAMARAGVQVLHERYNKGKRQLMPMNGDSTNDLGEYRIHGLNPGRYYVMVGQQRQFEVNSQRPKRTGGEPELSFANLFYPGVTDSSQASVLELTAGQEARGIDFKMHKVPSFRVRGRVIDETGKPATNAAVNAIPSESMMGGFGRGGGSVRNTEGNFELAGLIPGAYTLLAHKMGGREETRVMGVQQISVGSRDVDNVVLNMVPASDMTGLIKVEGGEPIQPGNVRVTLEPFVQSPFGFAGGMPSKPDGTFTIQNVMPGKVRPSVAMLPEGTYLKSVKVNGLDVLESGFTTSAGGAIEVILGGKAPQLTGNVQDEKGQPLQGVLVTLVPDSSRREHYWRYGAASTDQNGAFTIRNLAPGEYKAFAFTDMEDGALQSPELLKQYEAKGQEVKLQEGSTETLVLKVIQ